ncbi:MAG TPA: tryptophan-rich sensory protein, partial [Rubricoccaceae bacterium]
MRGLPRQTVVVLAVAVNLGLNGLAGAGRLFGVPVQDVSDEVPTGITPDDWAFGIWGVIFLLLVVYAGFQARPAARGPRYDAPAAPFALANVLNGLWQVPWLTRHFGLALLVLVGVLGSLVWLYVVHDRMRLRENEIWALHIPGSYFLAWTSVATALNAAVWLKSLGWTGPEAVWAPVAIAAVAGAGAWLLSRTGDTAVAAVLLWAFAGVYAAHAGATSTVVALAAGAAAVVVSAVTGAIRRAE